MNYFAPVLVVTRFLAVACFLYGIYGIAHAYLNYRPTPIVSSIQSTTFNDAISMARSQGVRSGLIIVGSSLVLYVIAPLAASLVVRGSVPVQAKK